MCGCVSSTTLRSNPIVPRASAVQEEELVGNPPAPSIETRSVSLSHVTLDAIIRKETVRLDCTRLKFEFSANSNCRITLYYFAREVGENLYQTESLLPQPSSYDFGPGPQKFDKPFPQLSLYSMELLTFRDGRTYPLVIMITSVYSEMSKPKQAQITCFLINKEGDNYQFKSIAQKVILGEKTFNTQNVYGIAQQSTECVVCMDEAPNTTVMPCGHLCMCRKCSEVIKETENPECPVCRRLILQFNEVTVR